MSIPSAIGTRLREIETEFDNYVETKNIEEIIYINLKLLRPEDRSYKLIITLHCPELGIEKNFICNLEQLDTKTFRGPKQMIFGALSKYPHSKFEAILTEYEKEEPLFDIMTFAEASEKWGLGESTLRSAVNSTRLDEGIDYRKSGKVWLITKVAMERVYGKLENKE